MTLDRKIDAAIKLLQSIPTDEGPIEICYSGGKDSDVILELAKMAGINYRAIYKNTTIDPRGTMQHVREMGVEVVQPKENFLNLVRRKGMPSRFSRFCCEILKEYPILPRAVLGIRRNESRKRAERYKEPELCRVYSGGTKVRQYLPILEWSNEDVAEFIKRRNIKCAPVYYDEDGKFDVNRRLGCIGCPLASKNIRRKGFLDNPKMLLAMVIRLFKIIITKKLLRELPLQRWRYAVEMRGCSFTRHFFMIHLLSSRINVLTCCLTLI